jgi:phosphoglycolate phosphatase
VNYLERAKIELAVFDLDGTLVYSDEAISMCFNQALAEMGHPRQSIQSIARLIGLPLLNMFAEFIPQDETEEAVRRYRSHYQTVCIERTTLLDGAMDLLHDLQNGGVQLAVATNKPLGFTRDILQATGIAAFFTEVAGPENVELPKPHPAMLEYIMVKLDVSPVRTMYVGDSLTDCYTAKAAEVSMFAVATGAHTQSELATAKPFWLGDSLSELRQFLNENKEGSS